LSIHCFERPPLRLNFKSNLSVKEAEKLGVRYCMGDLKFYLINCRVSSFAIGNISVYDLIVMKKKL